MKVRKILFIFILTPYWFYSQNMVSGTLYDREQQPIAGATVSITAIETEHIIAYGISNTKGQYTISFSHPTKNIQIHILSIGFSQHREILENKTQTKNFTLEEQYFALEEIIIKPPPIKRTGDTLSYTVTEFSTEKDRSIADVIKRMPGIEVLPNGQILYEGTPINKYYIEGLDLLEGRYNLANENLPHKEVTKVQILENHQPLRILDSLEFSDKAALNIQLKNKHSITGQVKVGSGFSPLLWDANITPMVFSKNKQFLTSYQTNNTGNNIDLQNQKLIPETANNPFDQNARKQDWLSIQHLALPRLSERIWLDNNVHLLSTNVLYKLKKDYQVKLNLSYLNDYQRQLGNTNTLFFTPNDTISLSESTNNQLFYHSLKSGLIVEKNTPKNYLKNTLDLHVNWDHQHGNILRNGTALTQNLSNPYFDLQNKLTSVYTVGKQLVTLHSQLGYSQLPQSLKIQPGPFENILSDNIAYSVVSQHLNLKKLYANNSIGFTKAWNSFTFTPKIGFQIESQHLSSSILIDGKTNMEPQFSNHLNWNRNLAYFEFKNQYRKGKLTVNLNTPVNFYSYDIEDSALQQSQTLKRLTFEPNLFVHLDLDIYWKLKGGIGVQNSFGTINQMHYAYILQNYRNLNRFDSPIPSALRKNINGGIYYRNPIKIFFGHLLYTYQQNENNLLYETTLTSDGAREIRAIERVNTSKGHALSSSLSTYFSELKTSVTLQTSHNLQYSQLLLNGVLTDINNTAHVLSMKTNMEVTSWFALEFKTALLFANNKIQSQKSSTNKQQSQFLDLNFHPQKEQYIGLKMEYIQNDLFLEQSQNIFADLLYRFTLKKKKIDLELRYTNIFNNRNYRITNITEYSYTETHFQLRPAQVLAQIRFTL